VVESRAWFIERENMKKIENERVQFSSAIEGWGSIQVPCSVPEPWVGLINGFSQVVAQLMDPSIQESSALRIIAIQDRLHFYVEPQENLGLAFDDAVAAISSAYSELSEYVAKDSGADFGLNAAEKLRVFSWPSNHHLLAQGRSSESFERMKATLLKLKQSGQFRALQAPPADWEKMTTKLMADFPNFEAVVRQIIEPHLAIIGKGGHHRLSPILLVGEPGIGKTHFAHAAAKVMGLRGALFIGMAEESNGSALSGSSTFWANSSPGRLFEFMAWGNGLGDPVANPLIILDEIDKPTADRYDPLAALYSLLEVETAARFLDQSLPDIVIDLSRARFIATANDASLISQPLLSQMTVFHIERPSKDQLRGVVKLIFRSLAVAVGLDILPVLPGEVVEASLHLSPREARVRLECAIAAAVRADRNFVTIADWPDLQTAEQQRKKMGFVP
jgi:hypothetical protein